MKLVICFVVHFCGKEQVLTAEIFSSTQFMAPGFSAEIASPLYCDYVVIAPEETRIRFWINSFGTATFGSSNFYLWVRLSFIIT